MKVRLLLCITALLTMAMQSAGAAPIAYTGNVITNGPAVTGFVGPFGWFDSTDTPPVEFWTFTVRAPGNYVTVRGNRLNNNLDLALSVYFGTITPGTDYSLFDPFGSFDSLQYIGSGDDEIDAPGPFGDPLLTFFAQRAGVYTIAIGGAASDCPGGVCPAGGYPYSLVAIPEPATLPLLLLAFAGIGFVWRRQRQA